MWIDRDISKTFRRNLGTRPVLLISGARQTGKTSLCRQLLKEHAFVSLDLPRLAEEAELSGEQFLRDRPAPLIIDEIQYAPGLFRYIKAAIEGKRSKSGLYVLTGSQKFNLMAGVSESLAGRVALLDLHSLSFSELERWSGRKMDRRLLLEWMFRGGYPELYAKKLDPEQFYGDYVSTYLERDVRQVLQVRNLRDFDRFMRLLALRSGQILSLQSFSSDIGISPNTVKSWLSVLEASQIIYLLEPYFENFGKRIVKTPKLYFLDTGLACFLAGFRSSAELEKSALLGAFFETAALGQLIRWHANRGKSPKVYFYRSHTGMEIDFVVTAGDKIRLYECKWAEDPPESRAFEEFEKGLDKKRIFSKSLLTPIRGSRQKPSGTHVEDCVDWKSLES